MASREEQKRKLREEREAAQTADSDAAARRKRTAYLAAGIGLIALIVVVALVLVSQASDDDKTATIDFSDIPQQGITLGDPDAPVTVVEFADLQCPFCRDFAVDDLPGIVDDYVRPGDVKMELRLLAFISAESEAGRAVAAGAAEQDLIWPFAESVYNNQGAEGTGYMTTEFLSDRAAEVEGLDVDQALAADGSPEAEKYATESDEEAGDLGVNNTPSFAVTPNGGETQVVAADELRGAIDDALEQADTAK